jgi:serine/threonine-protein kinase
VSPRPRDPDRTILDPVDRLVNTVLANRYHIDQLLAKGGFGRVYRARDVVLRRAVAIKVLHPSQAADRDVIARFRREAAALRRLNHRHTVAMYEFGEATGGLLFIAMELLKGESLWQRFQNHGRLPWWRVVKIVRMVCSALAQAHALDIIHRDLKPENIHLEKDGDDPDFVKVVDFGIAKILRGSSNETSDLTHAGKVVGTFDYMAPEQMVGGEILPASDIFTLGIVMYEMISGTRPFGTPQSTSQMLNAMISTVPAPLSSRSDAPRALDAMVTRCLARDPRQRYTYADELGADLERALESMPEELDMSHTNIQASAFADVTETFAQEERSFNIDVVTEGPTVARRPLHDGSGTPTPGPAAPPPGALPPRRRR